MYYVVAESLTNVAKYASASEVNVRATCMDGLVRVEVADDGVGGADVGGGSGLRGLADRMEALGGRFGSRALRVRARACGAKCDSTRFSRRSRSARRRRGRFGCHTPRRGAAAFRSAPP